VPNESVELATILVTDLVGSTRLANAVGPVRADELRDEHFAVLREAIGATGGHEFRNTGDGLMVAFGSASAAARCASPACTSGSLSHPSQASRSSCSRRRR
jgi:class 3 adenylate cyclase